MIYEFTLVEKDYLTHQLFVVSQSKLAKKRRTKSRGFLFISFLIVGIVFFLKENHILGVYFMLFSLVTLIFYPWYTKWYYKKHYLRHIRENYADRINEKAFLEISEEHLILKDDSNSESKISLSQVEAFHELKEHILIKIKGGQTLILPTLEIENFNELREELEDVANSLNHTLIDNKNWEWK